MLEKNLACLIYGSDMHYIDHLAPLSWFLGIPIVVNEVEVEEAICASYPNVEVIWQDSLNILPYIIQIFEGVISCFTSNHFQAYFSFFEEQMQKSLTYIWCPHGNSDKDNLEALKDEKNILIYGDQMLARLPKSEQMITHTIGNYRYLYHKEHSSFYKKWSEGMFKDLPGRPTFLFAPTWEDYENNFSFETALSLIDQFPSQYNLIVKFHPNTWSLRELEIERLIGKYGTDRVLFIRDIYPIYPLIDFVQGYIGDLSSIGYDFLFFDKALIFSTDKKELPLFECGERLDFSNDFEKFLQSALKNKGIFLSTKKTLRESAFQAACLLNK